ncbi:MAG: type II toxin-antitoxin system VapC family toxin [Candidatus Acidiferrum sp.]
MEPSYLIDTNTVIYIRKAQPESALRAFEQLRRGEAIISVITYGELRYGVSKNPERAAAWEILARITDLLPVSPLPAGAGEIYGEVRAELEKKGQIIGNNDLWIAAHAMAQGLTLVTNNVKEFRRVGGLKIQNWVGQ